MIAIVATIAVQAAATVGTTDRYLISRLGALCFLLSTIEYMIPKPLPFLRIGLANIPIMLAITLLPFRSYSLLVILKIFGQGLIGGTLFSWIILFSIAGTVSSAAIMYFLKKILRTHISYIGICVAGAFASNSAQLVLARQFLFGESASLVAPPFLLAGVLAGFILGVFSNRFAAESRWFAAAQERTLQFTEPQIAAGQQEKSKSVIRLFIAFSLMMLLLFTTRFALVGGITFISLMLLLMAKIRIRILPPLVTIAGIILFNLFVPFGKVLAQPLSFPITEGALLLGVKKALVLEGMLFLSRWALSGNGGLPGFRSAVLSDLFNFLRVLTNGRKKIDRRQLVASIDSLMFEHA